MANDILTSTRQWVLKQYPGPEGIDVFRDFELVTTPLSFSEEKDQGKILLKLVYFSNDPAQRTWIVDKPEDQYYMPPVKPGEVMISGAVGRVVKSFHPDYSSGDFVQGFFGWSEYFVADVEGLAKTSSMHRPAQIPSGISPVDAIALGTTAMTAYFGLLAPTVGGATEKDNLIVASGAAGATGSVVAQIAKRVLGVKHVWGIAGGEEKCRLLEKEGVCDKAWNYKEPGWEEKFRKEAVALGGIDVYFDNVGGKTLDIALQSMGKEGRIASCGAISTYDGTGIGVSVRGWEQIIFKTLKVKGFLVFQFGKEFPKAQIDLAKWTAEGKIKMLKTVWKASFDKVPEGMRMLLQGKNTGKLVTEVVE